MKPAIQRSKSTISTQPTLRQGLRREGTIQKKSKSWKLEANWLT